MTTLLLKETTEGVRRCDQRCYTAKSPPAECKCICWGRNHGVGLQRAQQMTFRILDFDASVRDKTIRHLTGARRQTVQQKRATRINPQQMEIFHATTQRK